MSQGSSGPPKFPRRTGKGTQGAGAGSRTKKGSSKGSDNSVVMKWVVRGLVGGLLIGLVIVAGLDFVKKGQASKTGNAWTAAFDKAETANEPLKFSELEPLIAGQPDKTNRADTPADPKASWNKVHTYTWGGTFRKYAIEVYVDEEKGSDTVVSKIDIHGGK